MDIYSSGDGRLLELPEDFEQEVLASVRRLTPACVENFLMLDLELRRLDPETGRCGLLDDRFEVYAIAVPQCAGRSMVVSLDLRGRRRRSLRPGLQHGAVPAHGACKRALALVERQRRLVNPIRES